MTITRELFLLPPEGNQFPGALGSMEHFLLALLILFCYIINIQHSHKQLILNWDRNKVEKYSHHQKTSLISLTHCSLKIGWGEAYLVVSGLLLILCSVITADRDQGTCGVLGIEPGLSKHIPRNILSLPPTLWIKLKDTNKAESATWFNDS